ncbi:MAG: hypothetical protein PVI03_01550 [Candidatus Thorarchaeota archaeon]|jgi:hypothetical protein
MRDDIKEAWKFIREGLPGNAGYDSCEIDEMQEYIDKFYDSIDILNDAILEE